LYFDNGAESLQFAQQQEGLGVESFVLLQEIIQQQMAIVT